jgi:hypothetical protein
MFDNKSLGRRMLRVILRGAVLGISLSAFFPGQPVGADGPCTCDDSGSGGYSCPGGDGSHCNSGTQKCVVRCP